MCADFFAEVSNRFERRLQTWQRHSHPASLQAATFTDFHDLFCYEFNDLSKLRESSRMMMCMNIIARKKDTRMYQVEAVVYTSSLYKY